MNTPRLGPGQQRLSGSATALTFGLVQISITGFCVRAQRLRRVLLRPERATPDNGARE
jgi:hypothetical protein